MQKDQPVNNAVENALTADKLTGLRIAIQKRIAGLNGQRLLVLGDVGLDEYVMGEVKRISPEAPVPVVEVNQQDERLGLAANVAQNIASLGGHAELIGVVGQDAAAARLAERLQAAGVAPTHLLACEDRPTTRKLRVLAGHHHIVRVDFEHRKFLSSADEGRVLLRVQELLPTVQAVILEDYAKGVFSERLCQEVIRMAHAAGKKVLLDPHPKTPLHSYRGVDLMTPNRDEAMALAGVTIDDLREQPDSLLRVGEDLARKLGSEQLVITRGKEGMSLFTKGGITRLPTYARQVFDVTGAGDTAIAALALAWVSGFDLIESCVLANFAAGVVVGKVGCVPCTQTELLEYMENFA
jgi:rfaE bifunctional protein kinase chain/domain